MDLTPIKVRGRRKKRPAPVENNNKNNKNNKDNENRRKRPSGRPLLPPQTVTRSSSSSRRSRSLTMLTRTLKDSVAGKQPNEFPGRLAVLEKIPVELLEKIFLYSLNVNLPRASPSLAAALSSERLYRVLVLLAFWDDHDYDDDRENDSDGGNYNDNLNNGGDDLSGNDTGARTWSYEKNILRILRPLEHDYVPLTPRQRKMLQSTILRCRWCTVERIQKQLPELFKLIVTRRWINAGITMSEGDDGKQRLARLLSSREEQDKNGFGAFLGTRDRDSSSQEGSYMIFFLTVNLWEWVIVTASTVSKTSDEVTATTSSLYPILSVKEFPSSILRGEDLYQDQQNENQAFTDPKTTYLETLHSAGGFKGTRLMSESEAKDITLSRDALQQGIHTSIVTRNPRALSVLLNLDEYFFRSLHGYGNRDRDRTQIGHVPLYTIPSDHFRTAAKLGIGNVNNDEDDNSSNNKPRDDAVSLFGLLLRASAESVPYDDWMITQFAMDIDGPFGKWLLELMMDLPGHVERAKEAPRTDALFYLGRPNGLKVMARRYASIFGLRLE